MTTKHMFVGAASAALMLSAMLSLPALAAEAAAKTDAPPCLIAGWEQPASICAVHTKTIAATCFICHGPNGKSSGAVPSLAGQDKAYLAAAMRDFKSGKRESTVMKKYAMGYSDAEYDDLAALFAAIK
jgi:sulfide dehydrogenase cytochrome subunit